MSEQHSNRLTLCPRSVTVRSVGGEDVLPLAGGPLSFERCEAVWREGTTVRERAALPLQRVVDWAESRGLGDQARCLLDRLSRPRAPFAGLSLSHARIMAIVNVTPDSFSDGGDRLDRSRAIADALEMWEAGADILDVGGESTRPGALPVSCAEEIDRVCPVIEALSAAGARVSVDSRHAEVMAAARKAGAGVINDVTALTGDSEALAVAVESNLPVILMHMQGEPQTMQKNPSYVDAPLDIFDYLEGRLEACAAAGLPREKVIVDPGIGFGKNLAHNLRVLDHMGLFHGLGCGVLLGASRKSFIGRLSGGASAPKDRLPGSLAAALASLARGVQLFRVHDVAQTRQALDVWQAICQGGENKV
ncbi:MAG: dihydropteroate synthase [Pseudomonadota bacterium]